MNAPLARVRPELVCPAGTPAALRTAVETGKWADGTRLSAEQRELYARMGDRLGVAE